MQQARRVMGVAGLGDRAAVHAPFRRRPACVGRCGRCGGAAAADVRSHQHVVAICTQGCEETHATRFMFRAESISTRAAREGMTERVPAPEPAMAQRRLLGTSSARATLTGGAAHPNRPCRRLLHREEVLEDLIIHFGLDKGKVRCIEV